MRILQEETGAVMIDIQEKLFPVISEGETLLSNCIKLIDGLHALSVPIIVTQQYTKGLGMTVPPLVQKFHQFDYIDNVSFSCYGEPSFRERLLSLNKHNILLFGIETHVCVLQTCLDLLENRFIPVVIEDCVSSRNLNDKKIAVERMRQEGARITTFESFLFELTRRAGSDVFKKISGIVK